MKAGSTGHDGRMPVHLKPFIFVCGLHRSGTSVLHRCLRAHPDISGFSDTGAPQDEGQHLQNVYPTGKEFGGIGQFGFDESAHLDETSSLVSDENRRRLAADWEPHLDHGKTFFIEKSPPNLVRTRFLQALFPESRFVVITRHPVATAFATAKHVPKRSLDELLDHWLVCHERFERDADNLKNLTRISYERFVADPKAVLGSLFRDLGLAPHPPPEAIKAHNNMRYFIYWHSLQRGERQVLIDRFEDRVLSLGYSMAELDKMPDDRP